MTRAIKELHNLFPDKIVVRISRYPAVYYDLSREAAAKGKSLKTYLQENGFVYGHDATILLLENEVEAVLNDLNFIACDRQTLVDNGIYQNLLKITNFYDISIKEYLGYLGVEYNKSYQNSNIDLKLAHLLRDVFNVTLKEIGGIFGVSKQRIDQVLRRNPENDLDFKTDVLGTAEGVFLSMIKNHTFKSILGNSEYWILNNPELRDVCLVWFDDESCNYCTKEDLPRDVWTALEKENMDCFVEEDFAALRTVKSISVLKRNCASSTNIRIYDKGCYIHNLGRNEYAKFLGYEDFISGGNVRNTDAKIVAFFEENLIDGEVYISSDAENTWIRQFASRNDMSIDELVEFYGYKKAPRNKYAQLEQYLENEKRKMMEDLAAIADQFGYVQPQGNLYHRLYTFAKRRNLQINDLIEELGFHRRYTRVPDGLVRNENVIRINLEELNNDINQELNSQKTFSGSEEDNRNQIVRNSQLVARLKDAYGCKCQLCNDEDWMPIQKLDGKFYSEVHHIIPLAEELPEEETLDTLDNMIVVCPNHHKLLHYHNGGYRTIIKKNGKLFFCNNHEEIPIITNYHLCENRT